jgi:hypothetical protein
MSTKETREKIVVSKEWTEGGRWRKVVSGDILTEALLLLNAGVKNETERRKQR